MLLLHPRIVRFGQITLDNVTAVAVDRLPHRTAEDWSDLGPYATFADVPEQRTRIVVEQELTAADLTLLRPGDQATLTLAAAPTATEAHRKRLSALAVVLSVEHTISLKRGALRRITLAAISPDGAADPIAITDDPTGHI